MLLCDEPLSNLDAKLRVAIREQIRRRQKGLAITSLYMTHDQAEAMVLSAWIVVMNQGRVQQVKTHYEIYAQPANAFVAVSIGRADFLKARVVREGKNEIEIELSNGKHVSTPALAGLVACDSVIAVVRSEAVDLVPPEAGDLQGKVVFAHYTGPLARSVWNWREACRLTSRS